MLPYKNGFLVHHWLWKRFLWRGVLVFQSVWEYCKFRQQLFTNIISVCTRVMAITCVFYWHWLDEINQLPSSKTVLLYTPASSSSTYPRLYVLCTKCYIIILIILCCTSFNKIVVSLWPCCSYDRPLYLWYRSKSSWMDLNISLAPNGRTRCRWAVA